MTPPLVVVANFALLRPPPGGHPLRFVAPPPPTATALLGRRWVPVSRCAGLRFGPRLTAGILSLPQGYDTPVGELGSTLSGGERQRLGVARAFLHDAPYILLDEPTSNLDSLNEAVILKSLAEERKDKTVVLVSHRASTMRIADRTYSVENGRMS